MIFSFEVVDFILEESGGSVRGIRRVGLLSVICSY